MPSEQVIISKANAPVLTVEMVNYAITLHGQWIYPKATRLAVLRETIDNKVSYWDNQAQAIYDEDLAKDDPKLQQSLQQIIDDNGLVLVATWGADKHYPYAFYRPPMAESLDSLWGFRSYNLIPIGPAGSSVAYVRFDEFAVYGNAKARVKNNSDSLPDLTFSIKLEVPDLEQAVVQFSLQVGKPLFGAISLEKSYNSLTEVATAICQKLVEIKKKSATFSISQVADVTQNTDHLRQALLALLLAGVIDAI